MGSSISTNQDVQLDIQERDLEDSELAMAAAGGDQRAFDMLVERYRGYIYSIAYKITLHEEDALDVSQNVLLRLVERIGQFSGRGAFKGWLGSLTANEAVTYTRARQRHIYNRADLESEEFEQCAPAEQADIRERLDEVARRRHVEEAMQRLTPQQRAIFALRFRSGMKQCDIARELKLPAAQVRSQMSRALSFLRSVLHGKKSHTGGTRHTCALKLRLEDGDEVTT